MESEVELGMVRNAEEQETPFQKSGNDKQAPELKEDQGHLGDSTHRSSESLKIEGNCCFTVLLSHLNNLFR